MTSQTLVLIYLIGMNTLVFLLMAYDKQQAKRQRWRIREQHLLLLGLAGGGIGGLLGQYFCHHKTRKKMFKGVFLLGSVFALWLWLSS